MKHMITHWVLISALLSVSSGVMAASAITVPAEGAVMPVKIIGHVNGVPIEQGGYGSSAFGDAKHPNRFYAITDRGPNADGVDEHTKVFPVPDFHPSIGYFELEKNGRVRLLKNIVMRRPNGRPLTGLPNPKGLGSTGETAVDGQGKVLPPDEYGIDSEGLVVMRDGSFWVSDEYGPHMVHFNRAGIEQERISPVGIHTQGRKLPAVLAMRRPNRGMEGLAITPDQRTLVGIMQSTLNNPSKKAALNQTLTRIVTFDLQTGKTHQYLYRQNGNGLSNSEIRALDGNRLLVDERDGQFPGAGKEVQKQVYLIDLRTGTDVSGDFNDPNGLKVGGKTLEESSWADLAAAGIQPVKKTLVLDLVKAFGYPHDKFESMWLMDAGHLAVINDDDFGITSENGKVLAKTLPATGKLDQGTVYVYPIHVPESD